MASTIRKSVKVFSVLAGIVIATSASAAPIGEISQDCFSKATLQRTLDHAHCTGLPLQLRDQCIIQTELTYANAVAACASKGVGTRPVTPKQNTDAPFTRRMRF